MAAMTEEWLYQAPQGRPQRRKPYTLSEGIKEGSTKGMAVELGLERWVIAHLVFGGVLKWGSGCVTTQSYDQGRDL
jgi:hypothetical protein